MIKQDSIIQDILGYLDEVLHPLVSPDNWNVYSDLHDMVSMLPSAEPKKGKWECSDDTWKTAICSVCKLNTFARIDYAEKHYKFCPLCGATMEVTE